MSVSPVFVNNATVAKYLTPEIATKAVETVFTELYRQSARNFPVVRERIEVLNAVFGIKSGVLGTSEFGATELGLKAGGYWPGNAAHGLENHQSSVILLNSETGQISAVVEGGLITALRTAAASATSIARLARQDASTLTIVGAGGQAPYQLDAALRAHPFQAVLAWNRSPEKLAALEAIAKRHGVAFKTPGLEASVRQADVIITILSSQEPLVKADWVAPGTHLACMGTDTIGKQEVEPSLLARSQIFTDEIAQSVKIGEAQHAVQAGLLAVNAIAHIGAVVSSDRAGRTSGDEITLFDGTGVALQDIVCARAVLKASSAEGDAN